MGVEFCHYKVEKVKKCLRLKMGGRKRIVFYGGILKQINES